MMEVFVLRHGQAEPQCTTDEARNLTQKGRMDVAASANNSLEELMRIKEIWASPLVRAQQTAEIVQAILREKGVSVDIKTTSLIEPESHPRAFFQKLQEESVPSVLLASHMPFVGDFLDLFCGGARGGFMMATSSLAKVSCEIPAAGLGDLCWLRHVNE
jgi:phosphohistidine phosphatase